MSGFKPLEPRNLGRNIVDVPVEPEPDYKALYERYRYGSKILANNCLMWLNFTLETYDDPKVQELAKKAKADMEKLILSL